ncbi:MAG: hypothetical protein WBS24_13535 [Terriglobales bacterium]
MKFAFVFTLLCASLAFAKDHPQAQSGNLLQMDSVQCGTEQKSAKNFAGELIGTDDAHQKTHTLLCQEYQVQTDRVLYRIRPRDDKHPALLPVGEHVQFYIEKDYMKLRVEDLDNKEREYVVVSMTPRADAQSAANHK